MRSLDIYLILILPIFLTGLIHHFVIIKNNIFPSLTRPVDFGKKYKGKRIFGDQKTFRGFVIVTFFSAIFTYLVYNSFRVKVPLKYSPLVSGAILGLFYSLAELPTSFFKRQIDIAPSMQAEGIKGKIVNLIDQSDSVVGTIIAANLLAKLDAKENIILFILGFGLHWSVDTLLYKFSYKKKLTKKRSTQRQP